MRTTVRKIGNSAGAIIPAHVLKQLKLSEGDTVDVSVKDGCILIRSAKDKPKYTLAELLAKCNPEGPTVTDLEIWEQSTPVGKEV